MTSDHAEVYRVYRNALRDGALVRGSACARPGEPQWRCSPGSLHGHHPDYAKPLSVVWLCATHHGLVHHNGWPVTAEASKGDA